MNFNEFQQKYNELYELGLAIRAGLESESLDNMPDLLKKKADIVELVEAEKIHHSFSEENKATINALIEKIKQLDNENLEKMYLIRTSKSEGLLKLNKGKQVLSAYKIKKEISPRIFDERE